MAWRFLHSSGAEPAIAIPAIGVELLVRVPPGATDGAMSVIETVNRPGSGPPLHRHREAETFRVLAGRYLYELDGRRFEATEGDLVIVPGGAAHAFRNIGAAPARQLIIITPGLDAAAFFTELAGVMQGGRPDAAALAAFGAAWQVEFLGPPLTP